MEKEKMKILPKGKFCMKAVATNLAKDLKKHSKK